MQAATSHVLPRRAPVAAPLVFDRDGGLNIRSVLASEPGVVELMVSGLFNASAARALQHTVSQSMASGDDVCGVMVDLRRATILIDAASVPLPQLDMLEPPQHLKPIALVVPAVSEAAFRRWAWEGSIAGLTLAVFVDAEEALAWIRARARLAARSGRSRVYRDA